MKIKIILSVMFVAVSVAAMLFYLEKTELENNATVYKSQIVQAVNKASALEDRVVLYKMSLLQNYAGVSASFDGSLECTTSEFKTKTLNGLFQSRKVVLRLSSSDCNDCVYQTMKLIDSLAARVGIENVIVMAEGYDIQSLVAFGEGNDVNAQLISEPEGLLKGRLFQSPLFFVVDEELNTSHYFCPDKFLAYQTVEYFDVLKELFVE